MPRKGYVLLIRRWVKGQLVVFLIGAADGDVVEQDRGGEDGLGYFAGVVGDPEIFARGFYVGAKGAFVEVGEAGSANQLACAIGRNAIEQARIHGSAESGDIVNAFQLAVFGDVEKLLVQVLVAEALFGGDFENADRGACGTGGG